MVYTVDTETKLLGAKVQSLKPPIWHRLFPLKLLQEKKSGINFNASSILHQSHVGWSPSVLVLSSIITPHYSVAETGASQNFFSTHFAEICDSLCLGLPALLFLLKLQAKFVLWQQPMPIPPKQYFKTFVSPCFSPKLGRPKMCKQICRETKPRAGKSSWWIPPREKDLDVAQNMWCGPANVLKHLVMALVSLSNGSTQVLDSFRSQTRGEKDQVWLATGPTISSVAVASLSPFLTSPEYIMRFAAPWRALFSASSLVLSGEDSIGRLPCLPRGKQTSAARTSDFWSLVWLIMLINQCITAFIHRSWGLAWANIPLRLEKK